MAGVSVEFFWSPFSHRNEARKLLKIRENSEQNSGRKFKKFGELSFCNFSTFLTQKIAAFSNHKYKIAGFGAEIAEKLPEKIAAFFLARGIRVAASPRCQKHTVFGTLRPGKIAQQYWGHL